MSTTEQVLLSIFKSFLLNNKENNTYAGIDWNEVLLKAELHQIQTLLYSTVSKYVTFEKANETKYFDNHFKKTIMLKYINNKIFYEQACLVLKELESAGVRCIALKGLYLRFIYPNPELRSMADVDILVKESDIELAKKALIRIGYNIVRKDYKDLQFIKDNSYPIELHHCIVEQKYIKKYAEFNKQVWDSALEFSFGTTNALVLAPKEMVIHLLMHMLTHMRTGGFGLRQISDLVLFCRKFETQLDWKRIYIDLVYYEIWPFSRMILLLCSIEFGLKIPCELLSQNSDDEIYLKMLIKDILSGGVFGDISSQERFNANRLSEYANANGDNIVYKLSMLRSYLFPSREKLRYKYSYARKSIIHLIIAWFHRLAYGILHQGFNILQRFRMLTDDKILEEAKKRVNLMKMMGLK
ncbi:MAG: nucleotidyltransferase family protein [Clostridia bacterium]|nr:nucleotidyltransferase family protein [Clostridia bacterium]